MASCVSAQAEPMLEVRIEEVAPGHWDARAQLHDPAGDILVIISRLEFELNGIGISDFAYNDSFDSTIWGPATVSTSEERVYFSGINALPPLSNTFGVDGRNPLPLATFDAASVSDFTFIGGINGAYRGSPFNQVFWYQNSDGTPGTVPFQIRIIPIPSPATSTAVLAVGALAMRRNHS